MSGLCMNSGQTYGCEWSVGYLWHWMNWIGRLDVVVLALMMVQVIRVVIRVAYRYHWPYQADVIDENRRLAADLNGWIRSLKSIADTAPFLGLVGTCVGILSAFRGVGMEKHAALAMISSQVAAALLTTATGLLVAIPAVWSHNRLRTLLDSLACETLATIPRMRQIQSSQFAQTLPLHEQISKMPPFGTMAASGLAILVGVYSVFPFPRTPVGLAIDLPQQGDLAKGKYLAVTPIVIRVITTPGKGSRAIYVNTKKTTLNELDNTVRAELTTHPHGIAYVGAESDVPWAEVANVIDRVKALNVTVVLFPLMPDLYLDDSVAR